MSSFSVFAPASIGNVSVGFDILGAALKPINAQILGDVVDITDSKEEFEFFQDGWYASKLPSDPKKNIVYSAFLGFKDIMKEKNLTVKPVKMTLHKNLPIGSGLGSSAASIVAAVEALNAFHGFPLSKHETLELMGKLEGSISGSIHYDNVAPCFLGGMQLMVGVDGIISETIPSFDNWYWVSCYPGISVSTAEARKILPKEYSRADTITFGRQIAVFIQASNSGNSELAAKVLKDVLAEPYREQLIPGFKEAREHAKTLGALATGISGSGPSIFVVMDDYEKAQVMEKWLKENFIQNDEGFCNICKLDRVGTTVTKI
ncbi:MAG: homoserine kinase [Succinivibrionaceae bacterium]|nr:homoserine kinase [Ruminobacter sp.]MEE1340955.1 homoserine kinase [Succinivibrionaceae bacterium]